MGAPATGSFRRRPSRYPAPDDPPGIGRVKTDRLSTRALNRATLERQLLLARAARSVADTIEHLVGMQAQNPLDPYYGLWARLEPFDPADLSALIEGRQAVRTAFLRATIHLVTAADCLHLDATTRPVSARTFGSTSFSKNTAGQSRDSSCSTRGRANRWRRGEVGAMGQV